MFDSVVFSIVSLVRPDRIQPNLEACIGLVESQFFEEVSSQDSSHFQLTDQLMIFLLYLVGHLQVKINSISISSCQAILDSLAFFESTLRFVGLHLH